MIPVRPPLRPTQSFGSSSDVSYYSPTLSEFGKKSMFASVEEMFPDQEVLTARSGHGWRFYATFTCLALLNFSCDFSTTVLSTALPAVSRDLDLKTLQAFWLPGSLLLAEALCQPLFMRLAHALGCEQILLSGVVVFISGSVMSALAKTIALLFAGQCLQGIGVGATSILTELILGQFGTTRDFQPAGRGAWTRSTSHLFSIGLALGPVLGGACAQNVGWKYVFWPQVLLGSLTLIGLAFLLRLPVVSTHPVSERLAKVDFIGWTLLTAAVSMMTTSIFRSGPTHTWSSYHTWVPLALGFTCFTMWCLYNGYRIEPALPMGIFQDRSAAVACFGALVQGILLAAIIYFMPMFFQIMGMQPIMSGISLAPWTLGILAVSVASGAIISAAGSRSMVWAGWTLLAVGCGLMILFSPTTTATLFVPVELIAGAGLGLLTPSLTTTIESAASNDDESIHAVPLLIYSNTLGQCLGILGSGAIFLTAMEKGVAHNKYLSVGAAAYTEAAASFINVINTTTLEP